jgi:UDP-N-acetylglucosamine:LPS N-acetylglucosamine transferase
MSRKKKKLRICLAASAGGHLTQLLKLSKSWRDYDFFYVTTSAVVKEKLEQNSSRIYSVGECNREHLLRVLLVLVRCIKIALRERPDVVISSGAAAGCIMCFLGKLLGAEIVWVDSITNVERISLSGRMVRYIANLFLVQWPELAEQYVDVEYAGEVI